MVPKQIIWEITNVSAIASIQKLLHCLRIYQLPTGKVEQHGIALHVSQYLLPDDSMCSAFTFNVWNVE